jgi:DNA-binding NtrC family response regulator
VKRFSSGTRILVVDDDAGAAWSLAMILGLQGYEAHAARRRIGVASAGIA